MKILAITGSLRACSKNTELLRAAKLLVQTPVEMVLFDALETLPPFNPDIEMSSSFLALDNLRAQVKKASLVVFSTPEYAHGVPGALKNALDWLVGSGELSGKPVVLLNASTRGTYAQESLRETLRTMNAKLLSAIEATVSLDGDFLPAEHIIAQPQLRKALLNFMASVVSSS